MKRMRTGRWLPAALLLAVSGTAAQVQGLTIQSFDGAGQLSFDADGSATNYCIEWASSPGGPWTNTWKHLLDIPVAVSGVVTCSVPMFYRVVATAHPYLVVDLSDGPSASSYPISYLADVPPGGWTDEHKTTKLVLSRIPATAGYTMGSPSGELGSQSNETQHQVTLKRDFYIGVFEVTQRQWELVMGNKPSFFNNATYYQTRPVEQVSYYDIRENPANNTAISPNWPATNAVGATSFMGKLRSKTGLSTFDLPTESQWEYACRAGKTTALNSGKNLTSTTSCPNMSEVGRYWFNGGSDYSAGCAPSAGTALAGSYLPNAWGLYDMHGNVLECCLDWYGVYPGSVQDPVGAESGSDRVLRGGAWGGNALYSRSAFRHVIRPNDRYHGLGFRACYVPFAQP
jgi:formylglycine-generating enzyme required for sulfatase activity